jgi:hypothetical protein
METASKLTDYKTALDGQKPELGLIAKAPQIHIARTHQWGNFKYLEAGNYLRPPPEGMSDLDRFMKYLSGVRRHLEDVLDMCMRFRSRGRLAPSSAQEAVGTPDKESGLPAIGAAATGLCIAIQQAVDAGLLPEDPGRPWLDRYEPTKVAGVLIPIKPQGSK